MEFENGEQVEVCSKEDGFLGSYFAARVVTKLPNGSSYKVKYKNLVAEDDPSQPLIEVVSADELRPIPPKSLPVMFRQHQKVDALDKEGWWVGVVTGRRGNSYSVYFENTGEELQYPLYRLRRHLDFVDGDWVYPVQQQ